jgi:hypothetical protein
MKPTSLSIMALLFLHLASQAGQVPLTNILPSAAGLGSGWSSNRVVVLLDPLSSPMVITNEGPGWLRAAQNVVGTNGCEAYAVLRCFRDGGGSTLVWIHRYQSTNAIGDDWGRDRETKTAPKDLPKVGEEVRFYQRHGMHNNIAFRRGCYVIDVEGGGTGAQGLEHLAQLAKVMDSLLIKADQSGLTK